MCIPYLSLNIPNNNLVAKFLALRQQFDNQKMAIEDIIPLDVLFPDKGSNEFHKGLIAKGKKKKIDISIIFTGPSTLELLSHKDI